MSDFAPPLEPAHPHGRIDCSCGAVVFTADDEHLPVTWLDHGCGCLPPLTITIANHAYPADQLSQSEAVQVVIAQINAERAVQGLSAVAMPDNADLAQAHVDTASGTIIIPLKHEDANAPAV